MKSETDRAEGAAADELHRLAGPAALERVEVEPDETDRPASGSRPACVVRDRTGKKYFFKSAPREHIAAEMLAYDVRRLGRRPAIATAARTLEIPGIGQVAGMIQPFVPHAGERLSSDPRTWTELQREVMLREHPWEWLLANLDTHVDQYVLFGPDRMPLDVDWDHALVDIGVETLDRFTKRSPAIAPIRNALYDAYARGDVALSSHGIRREVRRIMRLDDRALRFALDRWAERAGADEVRRRDVLARFLRRKRSIGGTFRAFLRGLRRERLLRRMPSQPLSLGERVRIVAQDAWQRLLIDSLHDKAVVPSLRAYRRALELRDALLGPPRRGVTHVFGCARRKSSTPPIERRRHRWPPTTRAVYAAASASRSAGISRSRGV